MDNEFVKNGEDYNVLPSLQAWSKDLGVDVEAVYPSELLIGSTALIAFTAYYVYTMKGIRFVIILI